MAFGNYYNYPYYPQAPVQPSQPAQQAGNGLIWVSGESAAKAYLTAPGSSVLLMDAESNRFFIKSTDNSGMPLPLRVFEYVEKTQGSAPVSPAAPSAEYVTREEFENFKKMYGKEVKQDE